MIPLYSPAIRRREMDSVLGVLVDEKVGCGKKNEHLAELACEFLDCAEAAVLRNPETALSCAFRALGISQPAKVMISALAPLWQLLFLENAGFEPILLDIEESSGLVSADSVKNGMREGGRVLILSETFGIVPSSEEIESILALGIPVIEDISQSAGALFLSEKNFSKYDEKIEIEQNTLFSSEKDGKKAGTLGIFAIMGLEERDIVTGGGGAILLTSDRRAGGVLKKICEDAPPTQILGDLNCALAFAQIKEFGKSEQSRKSLFSAFSRALSLGANKQNCAFERSPFDSAFAFPVKLSSNVEETRIFAKKRGIETAFAYENSAISVLEKRILNGADESIAAHLRTARSLFLRTVLFPLYPRMKAEYAEKICKLLSSLP